MWWAVLLLALAKPIEPAIEAELSRSGPLGERLDRITRPLLGVPYVLSPLGEGSGPDPDPRFRLDAFDCTTFVETAMALARSSSLAGARARLELIRYSGPPREFADRRHLTVGQWNEELIRGGWLEDVSKKVGKDQTQRVHFALDAERWKRRRFAKDLELPLDRIPHGVFEVDVVPLKTALERADAIPAGTVLNVIREDVPWSPVLVSHQGLVLEAAGTHRKVVRHASSLAKHVIDEPLDHMIQRLLKEARWRVIGIQLLAIRD
jgi:hypothetical protein